MVSAQRGKLNSGFVILFFLTNIWTFQIIFIIHSYVIPFLLISNSKALTIFTFIPCHFNKILISSWWKIFVFQVFRWNICIIYIWNCLISCKTLSLIMSTSLIVILIIIRTSKFIRPPLISLPIHRATTIHLSIIKYIWLI